MAMTKNEFKNAFREAISYEFCDIPRNDAQIQHEFSPKFESKINKLIQKEKSFFWHFINTTTKRVAVFFILFIMLFTTAYGVKSIREPIVRFLTKTDEGFNNYFFEGDKTTSITVDYEIALLPDGFAKEDVFKTDTVNTIIYKNQKGDIIRFTQTVTDCTTIFLDKEKGDSKIIPISDYEVHLYSTQSDLFAMWIHEGYYFEIICFGNFNENDMIALIQSVKKK